MNRMVVYRLSVAKVYLKMNATPQNSDYQKLATHRFRVSRQHFLRFSFDLSGYRPVNFTLSFSFDFVSIFVIIKMSANTLSLSEFVYKNDSWGLFINCYSIFQWNSLRSQLLIGYINYRHFRTVELIQCYTFILYYSGISFGSENESFCCVYYFRRINYGIIVER